MSHIPCANVNIKPVSNIVKFKNKMVESYQKTPNPLIVSDYLSMMTDTYVLNDYERKFLPILHGEKL